MPRKYIPKAKAYLEGDLVKALTLIKQGKVSIRAASKTFRIDKSKLSRCINNKNVSKRGRKEALSKEQEKDLTEKVVVMAKWGFALSKEEIKSVVQTYVNENNLTTVFKNGKPGDDWFRMFCKRNNLSQKKLKQLEKCRRTATSDIEEGMTLAEVIKNDNPSDEEMYSSEIVSGDYILIKFATKKKVVHYVALVENVDENEFGVSYLRRKGDKFIFPQVPEKFDVLKEDVVMKLPVPTFYGGTARVSQQLVFAINFTKFNVS